MRRVPDLMATFRAVAGTFVPGPPDDAIERAARLIHDTLERFGPEALGGAFMVLEAYASARVPDASFASLAPADRSRVLRTIGADDNADLRDLVRILHALTLAAVYGDPDGWALTGYPGPSSGYAPRRRV